jgi:hypothetical protein
MVVLFMVVVVVVVPFELLTDEELLVEEVVAVPPPCFVPEDEDAAQVGTPLNVPSVDPAGQPHAPSTKVKLP